MPSAFPKGVPTPEQLAELDSATTTAAAPPPPPPAARRAARPPASIFAARTRPNTTAAPRPRALAAAQVQTGGSQPMSMAGSSSAQLLPTTVLPFSETPASAPAPGPAPAPAAQSKFTSQPDLIIEPHQCASQECADTMPANSQQAPDYKSLYEESKRIQDDLYAQLEKRDSDEASAVKSNERLREELRTLRSQKAFVDNINSDYDREARERKKTDEDTQKEKETLSKQRADYKKQSEELQRWADSLQSELNEEKDACTKANNRADDLQTDLNAAQSQIDDLTAANEFLSQAVTENDTAGDFLRVINDNLEQVFQDQAKELNPDSFSNHLKRLTEQAEINQQSSQVSLHEKFNNDLKPKTTSRTQRNRQTSLSEDLAKAIEHDEESPDNSTSKPDTRDYDQLEQKIKDLEKQNQAYADDLAKAQQEQKEKNVTIEKQNKRIRMLNDQNDDLMRFEDRYKPDPKPNGKITDGKKPVQVTAATQTAPLTPNTPVSDKRRIKYVVRKEEKHGHKPTLFGSIFVIFLVLCFMLWTGHYGQLQEWRHVNLGGYHDIQYSNSKPIVYGLASRLEKLMGFDTTLLG